MKQSLNVLLILLLASTLNAQTKSETINWINSRAPTNPILFGSIFKESQKFRINSDGSFEITAIIYESPINPNQPKAETTTKLKGHFKDFNSNSIKVRTENKLIYVDIKCFNNSSCIQVSQTGKSGIDYENTGVTFGPYYNSEDNLPERLKKAFTQLIIHCGGKKEAF
jgi:hypothetical protein